MSKNLINIDTSDKLLDALEKSEYGIVSIADSKNKLLDSMTVDHYRPGYITGAVVGGEETDRVRTIAVYKVDYPRMQLDMSDGAITKEMIDTIDSINGKALEARMRFYKKCFDKWDSLGFNTKHEKDPCNSKAFNAAMEKCYDHEKTVYIVIDLGDPCESCNRCNKESGR